MKLCCIFNYAPLYREPIYRAIDQEFDAQFCFGDKKSDVEKLDCTIFKKKTIEFHETSLLHRYMWRTRLISKAISSKYDVFLMTGDISFSHIPFLIICRLLRKPVYAWGHGAKTLGGKWGWLVKLHYLLWTAFLTYGEGGRKRLIELGIPSSKLYVIYNSLGDGALNKDTTTNANIYKEHFNNSYPTLLFVGRLTPVKQLDWIISALYKHKLEGVYYNVILIGDGSEREKIVSMVKQLRLQSNVWLFGKCYDNETLSDLIYNAELCVSPGNVGLTALHSMSFGTPVLSNDDFETQMPEYETIVPGETGELYKKCDFNDFCEKIKKWLSDNHDRSVVRSNCYSMINGKWNVNNQMRILRALLNK